MNANSTTPMSNLNGRVALIFGASRGIGAAVAKAFCERKASVFIVARSHTNLNRVIKELKQFGGVADFSIADVADYDQVSKVTDDAIKRFGKIDFVINNAGTIEPICDLIDSSPEDWSAALDVNLKGIYNGIRATSPHLRAQGSGTIINLSSGAATRPIEGWSQYCVAKAGAKMLTMASDLELSEFGIQVIGLSPGTVATDMQRTIKESGVNSISKLDWETHIPPEWVAKAVLFLCGSGGKEFCGQDFSLKTNEGRKAVGLPTIEETF